MKLTGYIFQPNEDLLGSGILGEIESKAEYYQDYDELGSHMGLKIWVTPIQLRHIKTFLNQFTNLEYTLEESN